MLLAAWFGSAALAPVALCDSRRAYARRSECDNAVISESGSIFVEVDVGGDVGGAAAAAPRRSMEKRRRMGAIELRVIMTLDKLAETRGL